MSYCRFSSEDRTCDAYVYEADCGWVTHVARNKVRWTVPLPAELGDIDWKTATELERTRHIRRLVDRSVLISDLLRRFYTHEREDIDHPDAGETFTHDTPGECADNLERLKADGFNIPQYAIDALRERQEGMEGQ